MAKKYIALKSMRVCGKNVKKGKQIVGIDKKRLGVLIRTGQVKVVEKNDMELHGKSGR